MVGYPSTAFLHDATERYNKKYERYKSEFKKQEPEQIMDYLNNRTSLKKIKGFLFWFSEENAKKSAAKEVLEEKLKEI